MGPADRPGDGGILLALITGTFAGILAGLSAISFAHVIFSGPLVAYVDQGVWLAMTSTVVAVAASVMRRRFNGTLWQIHSVVAVVLASGAGAVAGALAGAPIATIFASVVALLSVTALTVSVLALVIGAARLGQIAKSIPYPVIGGFLAAAGLLLVARAIEFGAGTDKLTSALLTPELLGTWGLPLMGALAMAVAQRRFSPGPVVAVGLFAWIAAFYLWLWLTGLSLADARATGLTLSQNPGVAVPVSPLVMSTASWSAVLAQWPLILSAAGIAVLGTLLNLSALELSSDEVTDLDREMRVVGATALLPAILGGIPGYHSVSISRFSMDMLPVPRRLTAIVMLAVVLGITAAGAALLSLLPRGLFVMLLVHVGLGQLQTWLVQERRRMPFDDFLSLLMIMVVTIVAGFVWAVVLGILLASLRFTVAYAQLPFFHSQTDGRMRLSSIERSDSAMRQLARQGAETLIFEMQGYMFFGTANTMFARIMERLDAAPETVRTVVVDFARVGGMDVSAASMLSRLARVTQRKGIALVLTGANKTLSQLFARVIGGKNVTCRQSLDHALMTIEDALLERSGGESDAGFAQGFRDLMQRIRLLGLPVDFPVEEVSAGTRVLEHGTEADCFILLEEGRLYATLDATSHRVATFLRGAAVGEIALVTGARRTASVIAETPCLLRRVTAQDLELLRKHGPELALELERMLATLLAHRLTRTTALVRALSGEGFRQGSGPEASSVP